MRKAVSTLLLAAFVAAPLMSSREQVSAIDIEPQQTNPYRIVSASYDSSEDRIDTFAMDENGDNKTPLPVNADVAISSDGKQYAFDGITLMNVDGTNIRSIANGSNASWSPDSKRIAFERCAGTCNIFATNADTSNEVPLGQGSKPFWSPDFDGKYIAFQSGASYNEISVLTVATGEKRPLASGHFGGWSPDGTQLVFGFDHDVYTIDADGSNRRKRTSAVRGDPGSSGALTYESPSWSPDGSRIAYEYHFVCAPDLGHENCPPKIEDRVDGGINILDLDSGGVTKIGGFSSVDSNIEWSWDGARLAFSGTKRDGTDIDILA